MKLGSFDGGEDGEHTDVGFVQIPKIFVTYDTIFFGAEPFERVYVRDEEWWG